MNAYTAEYWKMSDHAFSEDFEVRGRWAYDSLLEEALGSTLTVMTFAGGEGYQGYWGAIITDGVRIGLVSGEFGCCSACDPLEGAEDNEEYASLAEDYLSSVWTFESWADLREFLNDVESDGAWKFEDVRSEFLEFAKGEPDFERLCFSLL